MPAGFGKKIQEIQESSVRAIVIYWISICVARLIAANGEETQRAKELVTFGKCDKQFNKNEEQRWSGYQRLAIAAECDWTSVYKGMSAREMFVGEMSAREMPKKCHKANEKPPDNGSG